MERMGDITTDTLQTAVEAVCERYGAANLGSIELESKGDQYKNTVKVYEKGQLVLHATRWVDNDQLVMAFHPGRWINYIQTQQ